jgi:hypothetical protein
MVVYENEQGFGFTPKNELINGRAAMIGFFMIVVQESVHYFFHNHYLPKFSELKNQLPKLRFQI